MRYKLNGPEVPENIIELAKFAAEKAKALGIGHFTLSFNPEYSNDCHGEIRIIFSSADGRGRPCDNLHIKMTADMTHTIKYTPPSSN